MAADVRAAIDRQDTSHLRRRLSVAARAPGITALSHHSAAHLHGLLDEPPRLVHVLALRGSHPSANGDVIVHHTRTLDHRAVVHVDGIPVTDVPSTLVMMAAYANASDTVAMVRAAISTAPASITLDELRRAALARKRRGRAGPAQLLRALDHVEQVEHLDVVERAS